MSRPEDLQTCPPLARLTTVYYTAVSGQLYSNSNWLVRFVAMGLRIPSPANRFRGHDGSKYQVVLLYLTANLKILGVTLPRHQPWHPQPIQLNNQIHAQVSMINIL